MGFWSCASPNPVVASWVRQGCDRQCVNASERGARGRRSIWTRDARDEHSAATSPRPMSAGPTPSVGHQYHRGSGRHVEHWRGLHHDDVGGPNHRLHRRRPRDLRMRPYPRGQRGKSLRSPQAPSSGHQDLLRGVRARRSHGVGLRYHRGRRFTSEGLQDALRFLGAVSRPSSIRSPEGSGYAERRTRITKEQRLWVRTFSTVEELRRCLPESAIATTSTG